MPEDWEEDEEMIWSWYSDESGGSGSYGCLDSELESEGDSQEFGEVDQVVWKDS